MAKKKPTSEELTRMSAEFGPMIEARCEPHDDAWWARFFELKHALEDNYFRRIEEEERAGLKILKRMSRPQWLS